LHFVSLQNTTGFVLISRVTFTGKNAEKLETGFFSPSPSQFWFLQGIDGGGRLFEIYAVNLGNYRGYHRAQIAIDCREFTPE
jgi:hypothetical protein